MLRRPGILVAMRLLFGLVGQMCLSMAGIIAILGTANVLFGWPIAIGARGGKGTHERPRAACERAAQASPSSTKTEGMIPAS